MDYHKCKIGNNSAKEKLLRKKLIEQIKKEKQRLHSFKYLTRNVGKGKHKSLKRLHVIDKDKKIIETHLDRSTIKKKILEHNQNHYQ